MDSDLVLWKSEGNELAGHRNVKQQLMFLLSHRKMSLVFVFDKKSEPVFLSNKCTHRSYCLLSVRLTERKPQK